MSGLVKPVVKHIQHDYFMEVREKLINIMIGILSSIEKTPDATVFYDALNAFNAFAENKEHNHMNKYKLHLASLVPLYIEERKYYSKEYKNETFRLEREELYQKLLDKAAEAQGVESMKLSVISKELETIMKGTDFDITPPESILREQGQLFDEKKDNLTSTILVYSYGYEPVYHKNFPVFLARVLNQKREFDNDDEKEFNDLLFHISGKLYLRYEQGYREDVINAYSILYKAGFLEEESPEVFFYSCKQNIEDKVFADEYKKKIEEDNKIMKEIWDCVENYRPPVKFSNPSWWRKTYDNLYNDYFGKKPSSPISFNEENRFKNDDFFEDTRVRSATYNYGKTSSHNYGSATSHNYGRSVSSSSSHNLRPNYSSGSSSSQNYRDADYNFGRRRDILEPGKRRRSRFIRRRQWDNESCVDNSANCSIPVDFQSSDEEDEEFLHQTNTKEYQTETLSLDKTFKEEEFNDINIYDGGYPYVGTRYDTPTTTRREKKDENYKPASYKPPVSSLIEDPFNDDFEKEFAQYW